LARGVKHKIFVLGDEHEHVVQIEPLQGIEAVVHFRLDGAGRIEEALHGILLIG
jgi:hypothetical protein